MQKRVHIQILILFINIIHNLTAQDNPIITSGQNKKWDEYLKLEKPKAKLDNATGWVYDFESDTWIYSQNEIEAIDNFNKLELGIGILDDKKYLYIKKSCKYIFNYQDEVYTSEVDDVNYVWKQKPEKKEGAFVYILDLEQYKKELSYMSDSYNVFYLDILTTSNLIGKYVDKVLPDKFSESPVYKESREKKRANLVSIAENELDEAIKSGNTKWIEYTKRTLKIRQRSDEEIRDKLLIKFLIDKKKERVLFFIFEINSYGQIPTNSFLQCKYVIEKPEIEDDVCKMMLSEQVFDYLYYEVDYKKFMKFIQAPKNF